MKIKKVLLIPLKEAIVFEKGIGKATVKPKLLFLCFEYPFLEFNFVLTFTSHIITPTTKQIIIC